MGLLNYALSGSIKKFYVNAKKISAGNTPKALFMLIDAACCTLRYQTGWTDYLGYKFYEKSSKEKKEYVSIGHQEKFYAIVSPSEYKSDFTIKPRFLKNFKKFIKRDFCEADDEIEKIEQFLKKHSSFIIKPIDGLGGHKVELLHSKDIKDINALHQKLIDEHLFIEEVVIQHPDMAKFAKESCNTVRIMTLGINRKSKILFAVARFGNGKNNVDNFHQGGMAIRVDIETGKLVGSAVDKMNNRFEYHPLTKIKFDGYQLPNWDEVKQLVLEAALVNKNIMVVGWDVAITPNGATFIEGNRRPGWDIVQTVSECGQMKLAQDILAEINKEKGTNYKL